MMDAWDLCDAVTDMQQIYTNCLQEWPGIIYEKPVFLQVAVGSGSRQHACWTIMNSGAL